MKTFILLLLSLQTFGQVIHKKYYDLVFDTVNKRPVYLHYQFTGRNFNYTWKDAVINYDLYFSKAMQWGARYYPETMYYDKGHLIPKEDMRFDSVAAAECNVYTNVVPQEYHVNRGVWKSIENYVRKKAFLLKDTIDVWTGCIYDGKRLVWLYVPSYFWKVLRYKEKGQLVKEAYIVKNRKPIKDTPASKKVPVAQIEKLTKLKF